MPSSASSTLLLELMATGENSQTWGTKTNTNMAILDSAICGTHDIATTGGTTTPTNADYTNDEAKKSTFDVTGTLVSNATIVIPNKSRTYRIFNRTTGAFTLSIKTASGSAIVIPTATVATVYCDGSDVVRFVTPISDYTTGAPATATGAAASAVSVSATGNLSSTNAQAALAELQGDIDTLNTTLTSGYQPLDTDLSAIAALATTKGNLVAGTGAAWSALGVGTNGYALVAKSGASTGLVWAALIPAAVKALFYSASVDGWTIDTSANNYAVRIVSSGASVGATAGAQAFSEAFVNKVIAKTNLPNYTLDDTLALNGTTTAITRNFSSTSRTVGSGAGTAIETISFDTTSLSLAGTVTLGGSSAALLDVSYVSVGIYTKNAY